MKKTKVLSIILWITALHSFVIGIGLIFIRNALLEYLGFIACNDHFFHVQCGVFHIAMSFCYSMAAYNLKKYEPLIVFSIIVKLIATIFLLTYFIFIKQTFIILSSAISDLLFFCIILWTYNSFVKSKLDLNSNE